MLAFPLEHGLEPIPSLCYRLFENPSNDVAGNAREKDDVGYFPRRQVPTGQGQRPLAWRAPQAGELERNR